MKQPRLLLTLYLFSSLIMITSARADTAKITINAEQSYTLYVNGEEKGYNVDPSQADEYLVDLAIGDAIAVEVDKGNTAGFACQIKYASHLIVSSPVWQCATQASENWQLSSFNHVNWSGAQSYSPDGLVGVATDAFDASTQWIRFSETDTSDKIYYYTRFDPATNALITLTADDKFKLYVNGTYMGTSSTPKLPKNFPLSLTEGDVIGIYAQNKKKFSGVMGSIYYNGSYLKTNSTWKHSTKKASLWATKNFNDSSWQYCAFKGANTGLASIQGTAQWIWATDPTAKKAYFRFIVGQDNDSGGLTTLKFTADKSAKLYLNGVQQKLLKKKKGWKNPQTLILNLAPGDVLAFSAIHKGFKTPGGLLFEASGAYNFVSDANCKVSPVSDTNWNSQSYDDSLWQEATTYGLYGMKPWKKKVKGFSDASAFWIWSDRNNPKAKSIDRKIYVRKILSGIASKVINAEDLSINIQGNLEFNGTDGATFIQSGQAIEINYSGDNSEYQVINIRTENPDGRRGMIGATDSSFNVPLYWAAYDEPIDNAHDNSFIMNSGFAFPVLDANDPDVFTQGNVVSQINGVTGILAGMEDINGALTLRVSTDGQIWVYLSADYTDRPPQRYKTDFLVIELITLP